MGRKGRIVNRRKGKPVQRRKGRTVTSGRVEQLRQER